MVSISNEICWLKLFLCAQSYTLLSEHVHLINLIVIFCIQRAEISSSMIMKNL